MQNKVKELLSKVKALKADGARMADVKLPSNCYFLNDDEILCEERKAGDARYPYSVDGLNLWAFSSGSIKIEESRFNVMLDFSCGKEPNLCFFVGEKREDGLFFPVSVTGAGKLPFEKNVTRYVVYAPESAYFVVESENLVSCVRMFVNKNKNVCLTCYVENVSGKEVETYVSSYLDCLLMNQNFTDEWTKFYRNCTATDYGFMTEMIEEIDRETVYFAYGCLKRENTGKTVWSTTSRPDYVGSVRDQVNCSTALQTGKFERCKAYTEFTEYAITGDIIPLTLKAGESYEVSYALAIANDRKEAEARCVNVTTALLDEELYGNTTEEKAGDRIPAFRFEGFEGKGVTDTTLNYFIKNVFRQVEFCTRAKNYAGAYIGIRDIFQQLEASLMWIPGYCRKKIVEALGFIGNDGRAPRQYSYPRDPSTPPAMDMRPYIDQGVWIISTVYKYLCFTGDFSILDEVCGYYRFDGYSYEVGMCDERDSILDHLVRIANYLTSKLDPMTGCLRILYGDWNDALNGLGKTKDEGKIFGTGVSVMATLQFYQNLAELSEMLKKVGREEEAKRYDATAKRVADGLIKYAIDKNDKGERKIVHGWGDKYSFKIGSYEDNDGKNRDGLTSNAFWVISGALGLDESLKKDILEAYHRLDSKYGIKTFEPYFPMENKEVGSITHLPKGTAENGAVYIHATLFAIWSLFEMGESKLAWEQILKILPPTHEFISTSPFIMPNSFIHDPDKGFDGESMNDWFTGSGCVLIKVLCWYAFGVRADLDRVVVNPSAYVPFSKTEITMNVRGTDVTVRYEKADCERSFKVDGRPVSSVMNAKTGAPEIELDLKGNDAVLVEIKG